LEFGEGVAAARGSKSDRDTALKSTLSSDIVGAFLMALTPGTRIGPYEITETLGQGGMGIVFRARDVKLERDVAIKMLPEEFDSDPDRLMRFQREAHVLASLNHPHIAHIYGLEESSQSRCIVMELVEGETLADRVRRGRMHIDDAVEVVKQIADGLEAAHEKGITHRDLKPANIKITDDGTIKILDFGLAKVFASEASAADLSNSPTLNVEATVDGMLVGTVVLHEPGTGQGQACGRTHRHLGARMRFL
jgi:eukaryotic-like serine/threonine-protein kinase